MFRNNYLLSAYNDIDYFIFWLVIKLGPVLLGSKPAELLNFLNSNDKTPEKVHIIIKNINYSHRIKYRITNSNDSTKILFYNPVIMEKNIQEPKNKKFLESLGYDKNFRLEEHIDFLMGKIQKGEVPAEIGIFLGYPLKDIIGYIGHPSLKLTKIKGWRVYGDPRLSDAKYREFSKARKEVKALLEFMAPEKILSF